MKSIQSRLLVGLLLGGVVCALAGMLMVFERADAEADERADAQLRQLALLLPLDAGPATHLPADADRDDALLVQVWTKDGRLVYRSTAAAILPSAAAMGFRTLVISGARWRIYAHAHSDLVVQVAQPVTVRQRIAARMALRMAAPLVLMVAAWALLAWCVVHAALAPLKRVAAAVGGRAPGALRALEPDGLPPELLPIVTALNSLLGRIDGAMSAQRNFIADAAHELRSPLAALKLQLQLTERAPDDATRRVAFLKLHERLDRAIHVVTQLLTLARNEPGQQPAARAACDLQMLVREAVASHALHAESKAIQLRAPDGGAAAVEADVSIDSMVVLLDNLVDNALRYTQPGGHVEVSAGVLDGRPFLRVADNGPGVATAERARLFDRFYRPDGNAIWGCGLGLAIVKNIADDHAAEVKLAHSSADGSGLTVTLLMP